MKHRRIGDRYELEAFPAGSGGMGEVYFGEDLRLGRRVAVKFVRFRNGEHDEDLVRRFVRESRITARLEHPGVPAVYDVGDLDGVPYLVMQRIDGITVADLVAEQGQLPIGWACAIAAQTSAVLAAAHAAKLLHRDLKPANLMIEPDGCVKVLDFGLAVAKGLPEFSAITATGESTPGTVAYMAPEQIESAVSGPESDLYALGCCLHEMLTGDRLFSGDTIYAVMNSHVRKTPDPVSRSRPDVPDDLDRLVISLLEKNPAARLADGGKLAELLLPHVTGRESLHGVLDPTVARPPRRAYATVIGSLFPAVQPPRAQAQSSSDSQPKVPEPEPVSAEGVNLDPDHRVPGEPEDLVATRIALADQMYSAGQYEQAAMAYQAAADELAGRGEAARDARQTCRQREATCRAFSGQSLLALNMLTGLLQEQKAQLDPADDRLLHLRRQIALLQWGSNQREAATIGLQELLSDLLRLRGPKDALTEQVRRDLNGLLPTRRSPSPPRSTDER